MFDNVSCSVNTVSFQARASEILDPIMRMTIPNTVASKINLPYPDFSKKMVANDLQKSYTRAGIERANPQQCGQYVPSDYEWLAYEKYRKMACNQEEINETQEGGDPGCFLSALGAAGAASTSDSPWIEFWEPLSLACFSCLPQTMECKTLPDWHPYRMASPGLPCVSKLTINAQLGQNFAGNMCLAVSRGVGATGEWHNGIGCRGFGIELAELKDCELYATVFKPP